MVKNEMIRIRATRARKEIWREMAKREGQPLSSWLRSLADERVRSLTPEPPRVGR
ncbi:hypothetical protein BH23GEM6_BH23GEM6_04480 [soil metagenome]